MATARKNKKELLQGDNIEKEAATKMFYRNGKPLSGHLLGIERQIWVEQQRKEREDQQQQHLRNIRRAQNPANYDLAALQNLIPVDEEIPQLDINTDIQLPPPININLETLQHLVPFDPKDEEFKTERRNMLDDFETGHRDMIDELERESANIRDLILIDKQNMRNQGRIHNDRINANLDESQVRDIKVDNYLKELDNILQMQRLDKERLLQEGKWTTPVSYVSDGPIRQGYMYIPKPSAKKAAKPTAKRSAKPKPKASSLHTVLHDADEESVIHSITDEMYEIPRDDEDFIRAIYDDFNNSDITPYIQEIFPRTVDSMKLHDNQIRYVYDMLDKIQRSPNPQGLINQLNLFRMNDINDSSLEEANTGFARITIPSKLAILQHMAELKLIPRIFTLKETDNILKNIHTVPHERIAYLNDKLDEAYSNFITDLYKKYEFYHEIKLKGPSRTPMIESGLVEAIKELSSKSEEMPDVESFIEVINENPALLKKDLTNEAIFKYLLSKKLTATQRKRLMALSDTPIKKFKLKYKPYKKTRGIRENRIPRKKISI